MLAYRSWGISAYGLHSFYNGERYGWQPIAICHSRYAMQSHQSPDENCSCGLYARLESSYGHAAGNVMGLVNAYGKIIEHYDNVIRCEKMRVIALTFVRKELVEQWVGIVSGQVSPTVSGTSTGGFTSYTIEQTGGFTSYTIEQVEQVFAIDEELLAKEAKRLGAFYRIVDTLEEAQQYLEEARQLCEEMPELWERMPVEEPVISPIPQPIQAGVLAQRAPQELSRGIIIAAAVVVMNLLLWLVALDNPLRLLNLIGSVGLMPWAYISRPYLHTIAILSYATLFVISMLALGWYIPASIMGWFFLGYYGGAVMYRGYKDKLLSAVYTFVVPFLLPILIAHRFVSPDIEDKQMSFTNPQWSWLWS